MVVSTSSIEGRMRTFLAVVLAAVIALLPASLGAWGMDVHRLITRRALDNLPDDLRPFFASRREFISEHAVDPDLWRVVDLRGALGNEEPNHFLDIDGLDEPRPFKGVPRDWNTYVARYGLQKANQMGRLPWRVEEVYKRLVTAFRDAGRGTTSYAGDNARYLTAVLSHYIADANQPFHAVLNYDGQLTGQRGIHSRFETDLVLRNLSSISWAPVATRPVNEIKEFAFATLVESEALVAGILEADRRAADGRQVYDDEYFRLLLAGTKTTLDRRLSDAVSGIVSVVVGAWVEAGRPALPADPPRTPARIVRDGP
jgi:hypothetical protein